MMLNLLFRRSPDFGAEVIVRIGEARLLHLASGLYELRGGTWHDRQAVKEWASLFHQEAVWDAGSTLRWVGASLRGGSNLLS